MSATAISTESPETRIIVLCRGLQASGKSTFAIKWVDDSPLTRTRINRDSIREQFFNTTWGSPEVETLVAQVEANILDTLMAEGSRDVIVDNTNLAADRVHGYLVLAEKYGYKVVFKDFPVDLEELVRRDSLREKSIGREVITKYRDRFLPDGVFPPEPTL